MSYDMEIEDECFNITYNVAPMFYAHNEQGIRFIYNKTGQEAFPLLMDMYQYFLDNHKELEKLNPENGWGSWSNTVDVLCKMIKASVLNPHSIWKGD